MRDKEIIEGIRAVNELTGLLTESGQKLALILDGLVCAMEGEPVKWFTEMQKVSEMDEDTLIGIVMVATTALARIKVYTRGTPAYDQIKDLLAGKLPAEES